MPSRFFFIFTLFVMLIGGIAGVAEATPVAIGFPPPGVSVIASGASGSTAGRTFAFTVSQNPPTGYTDLYWTMEGISGPLSSTSSGGLSQAFTFQSFTVGTGYVWTGANTWLLQTASGSLNLPVRLVLNVTGAGSVTNRGALGLSGNASDPMFAITNNFSAVFSFQAFNGSWIGVDDLFNSLNTTCSNCVLKSATGQFYGDEVPEPASLLLMGSGIAGLSGFLRRRYRQAKTPISDPS